MSKSKRKAGSKGGRRVRRQDASAGDSTLLLILKACVAALVVARLLVPTEAAPEGDTLWIVQLWLGVGLIWVWDRFREGDFSLRLGLCDAMLWTIVAGHAISAGMLLSTGGNLRSALNLTWEWVGLGVSLFLMRQVVRSAADRNALLLAVLGVVVSTTAMGFWQHFVFYPRAVASYEQVRSELDQLTSTPAVADEAARQRRITELRFELMRDGIALDGPERLLWEARLRNSTEPFGPFALANTFAGWLAVWLLVGCGALAAGFSRPGPRWRFIAAALCMAAVAYCLLLTKSRTAWIGLIVGVLCWAGWRLRQGVSVKRSWLIAALAAIALLAGFVAVAAWSGGLDAAVVSEAPKSFAYRLQFWNGSWQVVREHPIVGVGPGNFRQHYLKHKLPESSEEIVDPHNLVLDLWANGGLLALLGFAGLLAVACRDFGRPESDDAPTDRAPSMSRSILLGSLVSFGLVSAYRFLFGSGPDAWLAVLFILWLPAVAILRPFSNVPAIGHVVWIAAGTALFVHLLGAGGIEMPAVFQIFLVLIAVGTASSGDSQRRRDEGPRQLRTGIVAVSLCLALFLGCFLSSTGMVLNRNSRVRAGDGTMMVEGDLITAGRLYAAAAAADPLCPDPHERLAEVALRSWRRSPDVNAGEFELAVQSQRRAIALDPHRSNLYRRLGQMFLDKHRLDRSPESAAAALESFDEAVRRYPQQAALRADFAEALSVAKQHRRAADQAGVALKLDGINRREGHQDKYLSAELQEKLRGISERASD